MIISLSYQKHFIHCTSYWQNHWAPIRVPETLMILPISQHRWHPPNSLWEMWVLLLTDFLIEQVDRKTRQKPWPNRKQSVPSRIPDDRVERNTCLPRYNAMKTICRGLLLYQSPHCPPRPAISTGSRGLGILPVVSPGWQKTDPRVRVKLLFLKVQTKTEILLWALKCF